MTKLGKGAGKKKRVAPPVQERPALDWSLITELCSDSTLKSELAKELLAEAYVTMRAQSLSLRTRVTSGTASGDDHKALSAVCSNMRRTLEALQLTTATIDPESEL